MNYIDKHLMPDEVVLHRTSLHWIIYLKANMFVAVGLILLIISINDKYSGTIYSFLGTVSFVIGIILLIDAVVKRKTSEFGVTNKRIIIKVGFIRRRSLEMLLGKVEALTVDQSILGRLFNYGTITTIGTGGTKEPFHLIDDPLEFRRQAQMAMTT